MTTASLTKHLKIYEIIMLCILVKTAFAKSLTNEKQTERVKRGHSNYEGNKYSSPILVSSGVLQYSGEKGEYSATNVGHHSAVSDEGLKADLQVGAISIDHTGSVDSSSKLESAASNAYSWSSPDLAAGYDVWLKPFTDTHANANLDASPVPAAVAITATHAIDNSMLNTAFSDYSPYLKHIVVTPKSQLHTMIASSSNAANRAANIASSVHAASVSTISDNIDFNNVADIGAIHYATSYGK